MRVTAGPRIVAVMTLAVAMFVSDRARAAVIGAASIKSYGPIVELHFAVRGRRLRWHLRTHDQQLSIDLEHAQMRLPPRPLYGREIAPVTTVRAIDAGGGHAQLQIEVSGRVDYALARMPNELVIRVAPAGAASDLAAPLLRAVERSRQYARADALTSVGGLDRNSAAVNPSRGAGVPIRESMPAQPLPTLSPQPSEPGVAAGVNDHVGAMALAPESARGRPLVVVDAGHGGYDPGTASASGVAEKDVALAIATALERALPRRGIDAELTRSGDTFLSLAQRTQAANRAGAELFISIHLNSSADSNTSGIETYYLNNTTDRATIRLARMENGVAGGYGAPGRSNLNYILADLRQDYKANESAALARIIEAETVTDIDASMGLEVRALGAKKGPFYVLVGALMPAVLVECGFLSNPRETQLLTQPRYQQALADGIAAAVVHYFNADAAVGNL